MRRSLLGRGALVVLLLAAILASAPRAEAQSVYGAQCVETNRWTFSPPLTVMTASGNATLDWSVLCTREQANASPYERVDTFQNSGSVTYQFTGNCALALITGGIGQVLVGGALLVEAGLYGVVNADAKAEVLVPESPSTPCNLAKANSVAVKTHEIVQP